MRCFLLSKTSSLSDLSSDIMCDQNRDFTGLWHLILIQMHPLFDSIVGFPGSLHRGKLIFFSLAWPWITFKFYFSQIFVMFSAARGYIYIQADLHFSQVTAKKHSMYSISGHILLAVSKVKFMHFRFEYG